jgi:hypothetical protein
MKLSPSHFQLSISIIEKGLADSPSRVAASRGADDSPTRQVGQSLREKRQH